MPDLKLGCKQLDVSKDPDLLPFKIQRTLRCRNVVALYLRPFEPNGLFSSVLENISRVM